MKKSHFVIGTVIGAAAGLVAGLLTAPKSGKDTRTDLKDKAEKMKSDAIESAKSVEGKAKDTFELARDRFTTDDK